MKVYVAGSSSELDRANKWMDRLRAAGIDVASTWVETIQGVGVSNPHDATDQQRSSWSSDDIGQVDQSDAIWFLVSSAPARGAYFEAGFAHARGLYMVFSGDTKQSIFCALGDEFATDEEAFDMIVRLAAEWDEPLVYRVYDDTILDPE